MTSDNDPARWTDFDKLCMDEAIRHAMAAGQVGEVPVGAVLAKDGRILAGAGNEVQRRDNPLAHAETIVIADASEKLGRYGFGGTTLYVTLEPCVMCAGALVAARIETLVFGTRDARFGGCGSIYRIPEDFRLNHRLIVREGLAAGRCSGLMVDFFRQRRLQDRPDSG